MAGEYNGFGPEAPILLAGKCYPQCSATKPIFTVESQAWRCRPLRQKPKAISSMPAHFACRNAMTSVPARERPNFLRERQKRFFLFLGQFRIGLPL